ncbi:hypothetical protein F2Q69_00010008 [Brassica cretica]|uniref:Uncharacterized protein n=1 Tax=Brassica cretica TaxID=69181 RepID=A0A8S9PBQ0_BRACR|nr:hypothetical protein F2Q69_00010008 [Brassica cretica]
MVVLNNSNFWLRVQTYQGLVSFGVGVSSLPGSSLFADLAAGRLHPRGYVLSPKAQYPLRDMDEQFASG